jgi:hypothetical protein
MKRKIIGIFICLVLIGTATQTIIAKSDNNIKSSNYGNNGISGEYLSIIEISSPDDDNYYCIMYCSNHKQTLKWITLIDEFGFEKAWEKQFTKLTKILIIPGTILLFGLAHFFHWYSGLFIKLQHKDEYLDFINSYDRETGSGMITYKWLSGVINKPIDFNAQPDNTWIENSWILDDYGKYIPNPEIWDELPYIPFLQ